MYQKANKSQLFKLTILARSIRLGFCTFNSYLKVYTRCKYSGNLNFNKYVKKIKKKKKINPKKPDFW